jgi:hypothetical protein
MAFHLDFRPASRADTRMRARASDPITSAEGQACCVHSIRTRVPSHDRARSDGAFASMEHKRAFAIPRFPLGSRAHEGSRQGFPPGRFIPEGRVTRGQAWGASSSGSLRAVDWQFIRQDKRAEVTTISARLVFVRRILASMILVRLDSVGARVGRVARA